MKNSLNEKGDIPNQLQALVNIGDQADKLDTLNAYNEQWRGCRQIRKLIALHIVTQLNKLMKEEEKEDKPQEERSHILGRRQELRHLFKLISDSSQDPIEWLIKNRFLQEN